MKKFLKLRLPALMIVFIMIISFSLPAYAASDGWSNAVFNSYSNILTNTTNQDKLIGTTAANGNGMLWTLPAIYPWMGDVVDFYVRANMSVSLNTGDRFQIEEKTISGWFGGEENYIISIRYLLGYEFTTENANGTLINGIKFLGHGSWQRYEFQGGASYLLSLPSVSFDITQDVTNCFVAIQFKCTRDSGVENVFTINNFNFHYGYGNPNSPEYPGYSKPDTGAADDLDSIENELKDQSTEGFNTANSYFSGFFDTIQPYSSGLLFVADVMNLSIDTIPFIGHLLGISLALGLFGFILGLAGSIAGAADRRQRRENRRNKDG